MVKAACLSKAQFIKLFKKHTGVTPYEYYIDYKISKLKETLLDTNLSITQAFAACNMDYNGHSVKLFKERVGVTPSNTGKCRWKENSGPAILRNVSANGYTVHLWNIYILVIFTGKEPG